MIRFKIGKYCKSYTNMQYSEKNTAYIPVKASGCKKLNFRNLTLVLLQKTRNQRSIYKANGF